VTPAEPGWEAQAAEFSGAGLLHGTEPSSEDYDAEPSREGFDEHRRHLRLVREQARRRANGRSLLVSAGIALLGVFCLGLVTLHVLIAENQFTLDRLTQTAATEQASYEKLRLQVAQLEAPARIVSDAEGRLGLVQPGSVTYLPATNSRATKGGGTAPAGPESAGSGWAGSVTAPQGDADWPSIKPYLSGSP
jgi:cell division protein FtsB